MELVGAVVVVVMVVVDEWKIIREFPQWQFRRSLELSGLEDCEMVVNPR